MTQPQPLDLDQIEARAARVANDPFFVSDCEGELQVWRESALKHVVRNDAGEITGYCLPGVYRATDHVIGIDLDSWDPGEDETDDQRRQDINDLVDARAALPAMAAEIRRLRARVAELRIRAEQAEELQRIAHETSNKSEAERAKAARRAAKAEALLLHFTAEAHRRKWEYDRGLNADGVPIKSEAFDALHRLGEEMRVELEKLRAASRP
jgi:hypothetical protein